MGISGSIKLRLNIQLVATLFLCQFSIFAYAVSFESGDFSGSFDTTVTYGQTHRASDVDVRLVAPSNGGTIGPTGAITFPVTGGITGASASSNFDDGNTNFQNGIVSNTAKFVSELDLAYKNNYGIFTRFTGFKDLAASGQLDRGLKLTHNSQRLVESNINLLDAYVWFDLDIGNMPLNVRVGEQVISWGESTFIQNSINVVNPFDVSKLRTPGSELKEALRPIGAVFASLGVTENLSVEAYYQYDWENTELEGHGSYFSTNDIVSPGGNRFQFGSGAISDRGSFNPAAYIAAGGIGAAPGSVVAAFDPNFATAFRSEDIRPANGGEFGAALRLYVPQLNDTELGLYYINYHNRTPTLNVKTGSLAGVAAGGLAAGTVAFAPAINFTALGFAATDIPSLAAISGIDAYAETANYFVEFRKDIHLLGLSFNTELGASGVALQGEYSFREGVPLQIDDTEILAAALTPLAPVLGFTPSSQLGTFGTDTIIPGFVEKNVSQVQMTATKVFGPMLKANQGALIGEFAITHVHGMPKKSALRFEAPGTFTGGGAAFTAQGLQPFTQDSGNFADATSWGYQIRGRLDYFNLLGSINVSPNFAWRHDVSGIAPVGLSGFVEDSKALSLGVRMSYQNSWVVNAGYTNFFGAGAQNLLNDRDFIAISTAYSF